MVPQQAQAEKLELLVAENSTGYLGVYLTKPGQPQPYHAQVTRGGEIWGPLFNRVFSSQRFLSL